MLTIDLEKHPNLRFRIDSFTVPEASRSEFEAATRQNRKFIETLPGFMGHVVFEKSSGPTRFNVATIAVWENQEAIDKAGLAVRAYYQQIGFDPQAFMARLGIEGELGNFSADPSKQ